MRKQLPVSRTASWVFFLLCYWAKTSHGQPAFDLSSLDTWVLSNGLGTISNIPARVPGTVHLDLLRAKVLDKGDPLYRYNELEYKWVTEDSWTYRLQFGLPPAPADYEAAGPWLLRFGGVDTVAEVRLNGKALGTTNSSFIRYTFELDEHALAPTGNVLEVEIQPAMQVASQLRALSGYPIPESEYIMTWANDSGRNFLRKPAADFGWDWGPAFVPAGLPGRVLLSRLSALGEVADVLVYQTHDRDQGSVSIDVVSYIERVAAPCEALLSISLSGQEAVQVPVSLQAGSNKVVQTLVVSEPQLWWPVGLGEAHLYGLQVLLQQPGGADGSRTRVVSSQARRVGLRTVELVEEPVVVQEGQPASEGLSFYFRVNGRPLFVRGANLIPFSVFGDQTLDDMEWTLQSAVDANMNMIRVWGGGSYLSDAFYDLADEKGLLVWQEIMLACALYPRTESFLSLVRTEVTQQVRRLQSHASLALWGGSNENEAALSWYSESLANRDLYVVDFAELYVHTVYKAVQDLDPERPWVDSSPSNGLVSKEPYVKRWGDPYSAQYGDLHYYDYYADCEDPDTFPSSRFVSEFGFQSLPSLETYRQALAPQDLRRDSHVLSFRQRHGDGNAQLEHMISLHFPLPPVVPPANSAFTQEQVFDSFTYLTQVQQARCYETAIGKWRRAKSSSDATMGILYWQLNDLWQGPTWSSMEYGGKWKALHYVVRRAYAPLHLSAYVDRSGVLHVHLTSDLPSDQQVAGTLSIETHSFTEQQSGGQPLQALDLPVRLLQGGQELLRAPARDFLGKGRYSPADSFLTLRFQPQDSAQPAATAEVFFTPFKDSTLQPSHVSVQDVAALPDGHGFRVSLRSTGVAPYVLLEASGIAGRFSDNAFLALPGKDYVVDFHPRQQKPGSSSSSSSITAEGLRDALSVRSLWDAFAIALEPSGPASGASASKEQAPALRSTAPAADGKAGRSHPQQQQQQHKKEAGKQSGKKPGKQKKDGKGLRGPGAK